MDNKGKKVLIVEDDQFLREFYQELLQSTGLLIDVAADGDTASQKIYQGGYDLIMLDIMLPKKIIKPVWYGLVNKSMRYGFRSTPCNFFRPMLSLSRNISSAPAPAAMTMAETGLRTSTIARTNSLDTAAKCISSQDVLTGSNTYAVDSCSWRTTVSL